jgi:hypothetical protein
MTQSIASPRIGDVLVSKVTASVQHTLSIVPEFHEVVCRNQEAAISKARDLARERGADAWLTEDNTHFMKFASYRAAEASDAD